MVDAEPQEIEPGSFSFRVSCYEQFHFTPDDVLRLPLGEAEHLAIYFTETAKHQWKERKEEERKRASSGSGGGDGYGNTFHTERTFGGDSFAYEEEDDD